VITSADYFAGYPNHAEITDEIRENASELLILVNALLETAVACGVNLVINPVTKTYVGGTTNGGWRPSTCTVGAARSNHERGLAVDVYDEHNELDKWLTDKLLEQFGLWREAPTATSGWWAHLQCVPPGSGRRTFQP